MRTARTIICFACLFVLAGARYAQALKSEPAFVYKARCTVPEALDLRPVEVEVTDLDALQERMADLKEDGRLTTAHRCSVTSQPKSNAAP